MKFYFKLVNSHLPHYSNNFIQQFSAGHQHYSFKNLTILVPKIKHEFPRQSLRYKLIVTLNETSDDILEMASPQSQNVLLNVSERELWMVTVTPVILLFVLFVMEHIFFSLVYI